MKFFLKKLSCCLLAIIIFQINVSSCKAQTYLGIKLGANANYLKTDISNTQFVNEYPKIGYSVGGVVEKKVTRKLSIEISPGFLKKNYSYKKFDSFPGTYENHINNYLQLPLSFILTTKFKKVDFFLKLGAYGSYWMSGRVKGKIPNLLDIIDSTNTNAQTLLFVRLVNYNDKYAFDSRKDNRFEFGYTSGIGLNYCYKKKYILFAEVIYNRSITDQQKKYMNSQFPRYNETCTISVGYKQCLSFLRSKKN
jgi:hypothetical protein